MKRVLMIGYSNKFFRKEYARNVGGDDCQFDILSFEKCDDYSRKNYNRVFECYNTFRGGMHTLVIYLQFFCVLATLKKYDAIHIHSVKKIESTFAKLLKLKCRKLVCTIYGSDFYRISDDDRDKLKKLFKMSDYITIETRKTICDFVSYYGKDIEEKIVNIRFGISAIECMKEIKDQKIDVNTFKKQFGVPKNSFVITIGYNATKEQHHLEIIAQLTKIEAALPANYYVVVPLGYGDAEYGKLVEHKLKESGLRGICLFDFYSNDQIARLRLISDIMIQLQDTDSLSSSMLEYLYADNIIITGAWLPYWEIEKYVIQIKSLYDLLGSIMEIFNNWEKYQKRLNESDYTQFLENNFMWSKMKASWIKLYD